jgi:hypothetical protein
VFDVSYDTNTTPEAIEVVMVGVRVGVGVLVGEIPCVDETV